MQEESTTHIVEQSNRISPEQIKSLVKLDVRSEEVQEIIGRPPHWLVRWGVTIFLGVLLLILLSTWFIQYPEVIEAPFRLTAINAPSIIESNINGKLTRLQAENNTVVEEGQVLAWLESTANHAEVLGLSSKVDSMRYWLLDGDLDRFNTLELSHFSGLGPLQSNFQVFEQAHREFMSFLSGGFYQQRRQILEQEMKYTRLQLKHLNEEKQIRKTEYELAEREYQMQQQLAEQDFIAPIELARNQSNLLSHRLPLQQSDLSIINNLTSQASIEQEILELEKRIAEQESVFLQAINIMKNVILEWESDHLLKAPLTGKLAYAGILQENQSLTAGQKIFYVDAGKSDFFGELSVSQQSFGKIQVGQKVLVRFSGYPHHEYGTVEGRLNYISEFPVQDSLFLSKVTFPDGLNTNYGRQLAARNGMTGQAEIITQDMRLIERIANNLTSALR